MTRTALALASLVILAAVAIPALAALAGTHDPDPKMVRSEIKDILSAPEYNRTYGMKASETLWMKVMSAIGRFLAWLLRLFRLGSETGDVLSFILGCVVVGLFLVLVAYLIARIEAASGVDEQEDQGPEAYALPSARPLIKEAERLAQAGDFRGAFRCAYLASISHLDEVRALQFEQSRTNWEYLRMLKASGHDQPYEELRPLTLDFDRKFYGRETCTSEDYSRAVGAYDRISGRAAA